MSGERVEVVKAYGNPTSFRGRCECGWLGYPMRRREDAEYERDRHVCGRASQETDRG